MNWMSVLLAMSALGLAVGSVATFSISIPPDSAYCGHEICTQAAHVGGVVPFALSNAQDLLLGY